MKKVAIVILSIILIFLWCIIYDVVFNLNIKSFTVPDNVILVVGEEKELEVNVEEKDNKYVILKYKSLDDSVASVNQNKIRGIKDGSTKITVETLNKEKREINVIVTSLITTPKVNNEKEYITCKKYTKEESDLLESILESRINDAGYKTRAGAVASARFLTLEFKSGIKYFNENGRLENHSDIAYVDGEGRFYHKGLYLTEDKYESIIASTNDGPKMWGCELQNSYFNKKMENGLNCSGFITWVLYNAGFDIKDVGAGDYEYVHNELLDLKPKEEITKELLYSGKVKVGDLIGFDGHIAMIIGLTNNEIYIAESYETGLRVRTFTYDELIKSEYKVIILMDNFYKNDGKLTNMW